MQLVDPVHCKQFKTLVCDAEVAMWRARERGRSRVMSLHG